MGGAVSGGSYKKERTLELGFGWMKRSLLRVFQPKMLGTAIGGE